MLQIYLLMYEYEHENVNIFELFVWWFLKEEICVKFMQVRHPFDVLNEFWNEL